MIKAEYYNNPFEHPVIKKYEKAISGGLKYIDEKLSDNQVALSKNKRQTPLGTVPEAIVYRYKAKHSLNLALYNQVASVLLFSPSPKELYVITHDIKTGKSSLVVLKLPNSRLVRYSGDTEGGELKYFLVRDDVPDSKLSTVGVKGNVIFLTPRATEESASTGVLVDVFNLIKRGNKLVLNVGGHFTYSSAMISYVDKR